MVAIFAREIIGGEKINCKNAASLSTKMICEAFPPLRGVQEKYANLIVLIFVPFFKGHIV